jgi:cytidylate kinase
MIITIDGPAGSGKSTAARELAKALGIAYLDTGATYRAVTYKALRDGVHLQDEDALAALAGATDLKLFPQPDGVRVLLDGQDVSREIRSAEVTDNAHYAARSPRVRAVLVELQRRMGRQLGSFVSEGRDQGSAVFPDADLRFYLDASPEVRARRRFEEMQADGEKVSLAEVLRAIIERDGRDRSRAVAPLVKPVGAIEIDTSDKTIQQVVDKLLQCVQSAKQQAPSTKSQTNDK